MDSTSNRKQEESFVQHLFDRISQILPTETGSTYQEVEADEFFVNSRKALLNFVTSLQLDIFFSQSLSLLEELESKERHLSIWERSSRLLSSVMIVLRLTSDLAEIGWTFSELHSTDPEVVALKQDHYTTNDRKSSAYMSVFRIGSGASDYFTHQLPPPKLQQDLVLRWLNLLIRLKSNNTVIKSLSNISSEKIEWPGAYHTDSGKASIIDVIDKNCASILKYLAAANQQDYFNFVNSRILQPRERNSSGDNEIVPYLELMATVYLSADTTLQYVHFIWKMLENTKKSVYQLVLVTYFDTALKSFFRSRPKEALRVSTNVRLSKEVDLLFEYIYSDLHVSSMMNSSSGDHSNRHVITFLATLLLLQPFSFSEALNTYVTNSSSFSAPMMSDAHKDKSRWSTSKLKSTLKMTNVSKRSKFIDYLLRNVTGDNPNNISNWMLLECNSAIVGLMNTMASISFADASHPSVIFGRRIFESVADKLIPTSITIRSSISLLHNPTAAQLAIAERHRINFFPVGCIFDSDRFFARLKMHLDLDPLDLGRLLTVTAGFAHFFNGPNILITLNSVMNKIEGFLKKTLLDMTGIIKQDPKTFSYRYQNMAEDLLRRCFLDEGIRKDADEEYAIAQNFLLECEKYYPFPQQTIDPHHQSLRSRSSSVGENCILEVGSPVSVSQVLNSPIAHGSQKLFRRLSQESGGSAIAERISGSFGIGRSGSPPVLKGMFLHGSPSGTPEPERTNSSPRSSSTKEKENCKFAQARQVMVNIFRLFKVLPYAYLFPVSEDFTYEEIVKGYIGVVDPLYVSLIDYDEELVKASSEFVHVCVSSSFNSSDKDKMIVSYLSSGFMLTILSNVVFLSVSSSNPRTELLNSIADYLQFRSGVLSQFEDDYPVEDIRLREAQIFPTIRDSLVRALSLSLVRPEMEIHKLLRKSFRLMHTEILIHGRLHHCADERHVNSGFVLAMFEESLVSSGTLALQRRIRREILKVKMPLRSLYDVWQSGYNRWYELVESESSNQTDSVLFRNFTGTVACLCGVFLTADLNIRRSFPYLDSVKEDVIEKIEFFVHKMTVFLYHDNVLVRENAKDVLGNDLHELALGILFDELQNMVDSLLAKNWDQTPVEKKFMIVEQNVMILQAIVKREVDISLVLESTRLIKLIDCMCSLVSLIPKDDSRYFKGIIRVCKLFRNFDKLQEMIIIKGAFNIKNTWLRLLTQWFEDSVFQKIDFANLSKPHKEMDLAKRDHDYLLIDCSIEASKALSLITEGLVVEGGQSTNKKEFEQTKGMAFANYFSVFLKALERATEVDNFPPSMRHKVTLLSDNVILCLTNLLGANVEVGINYALPIGYSENTKIRAAFMKVFVSIVEGLDPDKNENQAELANLINSVGVKNMDMVVDLARMCPASEIEALSSSLLAIYESKKMGHIMVSKLIEAEITEASRFSDILRRNSCATRSLYLLSRSTGREYLKEIIDPVLKNLLDSGSSFEVEKLQSGDEGAEKNVEQFFKYLTMFLDAICTSIDKVPPVFVYICQCICKAVRIKFPEHESSAVGSFIFLRFFCPAIVSPDLDTVGSLTLNKETKRSLILIARVIQNMSNGTLAALKWPLLLAQSERLQKLCTRLDIFLKEVSDPDGQRDLILDSESPLQVDNYTYIHRYAYNHYNEIRDISISYYPERMNLEEVTEFARVTDRIMQLFGQPTADYVYEIPASIRDHMDENPRLYEFMGKQSLRTFVDSNSTSTNASIGITPDGLPSCVLFLKNVMESEEDIETCVFRFFQVYAKIWDTKHILVIDMTGINTAMDKVVKFHDIMFTLAREELTRNSVGSIWLNTPSTPNNIFVDIKGFDAGSSKNKIPNLKSITFHDDPAFLNNIGLSAYSLDVMNDVRVTLHDVYWFNVARNEWVMTTFKLGDRHIQISRNEPYDLALDNSLSTLNIHFNNVYDISNISKVYTSHVSEMQNELTLEMVDGLRVLIASTKHLEIMKLIFLSQSKMEDDSYEVGDTGDMVIPSDSNSERYHLIAHFLLLVYMGLLADEAEVRSTAYNLLAVCCDTFKLNVGRTMKQTIEGFTPNEIYIFLMGVFNNIAKESPELTTAIWKLFLDNYCRAKKHSQKFTWVVLMNPFIKNIFPNVFAADDEYGPSMASMIIRKLINVSVSDDEMICTFIFHLWTPLLSERKLLGVIINEVISHAIERDSEDAEWEHVLSLITTSANVELCAKVIDRVKNIIHETLVSGDVEAMHNSWNELKILTRTLVTLLFDNMFFAQTFLADIFYIVALLVDMGPNRIRSLLHQLLMNTMHSMLSKPSLTEEQKHGITVIMGSFSSQKLKLLFGLNKDGNIGATHDVSKMMKFNMVERLVCHLMDMMDFCGTKEEIMVWKNKFNKHIIDLAFQGNTPVNSRAMVILGVISKAGIPDTLLLQMLGHTADVSSSEVVDNEFLFQSACHFFCYSRAVLGLLPRSKLLGSMFWIGFGLGTVKTSILFPVALSYMVNIVTAMNSYGLFDNEDMVDFLIAARAPVDTALANLERYEGLSNSKETFDLVMCNLLVKGLLGPATKAASIDAFVSFFVIRCKSSQATARRKNMEMDKSVLQYLLFIYLVSKQTDMIRILEQCDLPTKMVDLDETSSIPKILLEYLLSNTDISTLALYQAGIFFSSPNSEESCKIKFLLLAKYLARKDTSIVCKFYNLIRDEMTKLSSVQMSSRLIGAVFEVAVIVGTRPDFKLIERYQDETQELMKMYEVTGLNAIDLHYDTVFPENAMHRISSRSKLFSVLLRRVHSSMTQVYD